MGTFIEDSIKKYKSNNHEYEKAVIRGQIIDAKAIIKEAIKHNKKSVMWYYVYDSYDSFTSIRDNIDPNSRSVVSFDDYMSYKWTAGEYNDVNGVCSHLLELSLNGRKAGTWPETPTSFDYSYVERVVKKELLKLGCKRVKLFIGKPYKYVKWIISVSW